MKSRVLFMSIAPHPTVQLLNLGNQRPDYAIVMDHIPSDALYAVLICNDYDTPACRSRSAKTAHEVTDSFLRELMESGTSLESLHSRPCPFVHLLACDVPLRSPSERFALDQIEQIGVSGINTGGQLGFYPPSPPEGDPAVHRYQLRVVLLREPLGLKQGFSAEDLDLALQQLSPMMRVGECHAEMKLTAAELRKQRNQSPHRP